MVSALHLSAQFFFEAIAGDRDNFLQQHRPRYIAPMSMNRLANLAKQHRVAPKANGGIQTKAGVDENDEYEIHGDDSDKDLENEDDVLVEEQLEGHELEKAIEVSKSKKRGPTMMRVVHTRKLNEREVIICNEFVQPIGPVTKEKDIVGKFSQFFGTIACKHNYASLIHNSWHKMSHKDKIWENVLEKYDVPDSARTWVLRTIGSSYKVTRLLCGGFIIAVRLNHTMCDAFGYVQFLIALSEMTKGWSTPSTLPVWQRGLFCARELPRVTCTHHEYDQVADTDGPIISLDDMEHKSFFFVPTHISAIRRFVPTHLKHCSTFKVLTACLWRCRTIALQPNPEDEMRLMTFVNARRKFNPRIPLGYYGNAFGYPTC
ncbi:hypothetical protein L1987_86739 [Smallanthus sonchifolius]|uniref:Uncharacterized protein n=1 Tax=Smallanthus sonchifolius TaxID=185202 RepID=A0ACB8Y1Q5_9ASTR|nr:hypothetical protein L1987_86739 [Smallanthus sonchifolius]